MGVGFWFGISILGIIFITAIISWIVDDEDPYDYIIDWDLNEH